jgi:hypothetical protein
MNLSDLLTGGNTTLASILWPLIAGVILAACAVFFNKQTVGKFVKKLFDEQAINEESAKSLAELGFEKNTIVKIALRTGSTLRKVIHVVPIDGEDTTAAERYYIPDECAYRAEVTYNPDGSSILTIVIAIVMFIAMAVILMTVIPDLIQMASNAADAFKSGSVS